MSRKFKNKNLVVKYLVGTDFETPKEIDKVSRICDNPLVKNAIGQPYVNEYNVLQIKVSNETKNNINKGLIPLVVDDLPF